MSKHKNHEAENPELEPDQDIPVAEEATEEEDELFKLNKERDEWKDKYLRSMAEFENFRRRTNQEKADWIKRSTEKLALNVCDVLDNFERALAQFAELDKDEKLFQGVSLIEQQLRNVLEKEGVVKIEALGQEFDPALHEALAHIPSEDFEENTVAAIIQNGYTMQNIVIRPVRVAVSSGKPAATDEDINNNE